MSLDLLTFCDIKTFSGGTITICECEKCYFDKKKNETFFFCLVKIKKCNSLNFINLGINRHCVMVSFSQEIGITLKID